MTKRFHALITGGSSGIGLALAQLLWLQGWNLTLIARDADKLREATALLGSREHQHLFTTSADVADSFALDSAITQSLEMLGTPEYVITSAGVACPGHSADLDLSVYEHAMQVNFFGTLHAVRAVMPAMRKQKRGRIIMISSAAALVGVYGYSAYSPSKFAVRGLASVLRGELKPDGVKVSVVYPPDTDTPQLARENLTKPAETLAISANAKIRTAEDVATTILAGVRRNKFTITPGWEVSLLAKLNCIIEPILQFHFDRLVAKVRKNILQNPR